MSPPVQAAPQRIVFAGTPDFALPALKALVASPAQDVVAVYTRPDRPAGRGRRMTPSPVKRQALDLRLSVRQPEQLRGPDAAAHLAGLEPDLLVVVAYGLILPPEILEVPRLGGWNIHASLLPRWRGAAPIERALLAGDDTTGVTIMQMAAGLDTGDVLLTRETAITPEDTGGSLHDRLSELGARALMEALAAQAEGRLAPTRQNEAEACTASRLTRADRELDWTRPAAALARQVRALNPRHVAVGALAGETVRVWEARALEAAAEVSEPGRVVAADRAGIDIATGKGVLRVLRLQRPGRRALSAAEYLNGRPALRRARTP